jgi:hypothetical protein
MECDVSHIVVTGTIYSYVLRKKYTTHNQHLNPKGEKKVSCIFAELLQYLVSTNCTVSLFID